MTITGAIHSTITEQNKIASVGSNAGTATEKKSSFFWRGFISRWALQGRVSARQGLRPTRRAAHTPTGGGGGHERRKTLNFVTRE